MVVFLHPHFGECVSAYHTLHLVSTTTNIITATYFMCRIHFITCSFIKDNNTRQANDLSSHFVCIAGVVCRGNDSSALTCSFSRFGRFVGWVRCVRVPLSAVCQYGLSCAWILIHQRVYRMPHSDESMLISKCETKITKNYTWISFILPYAALLTLMQIPSFKL